MLVRGRRYNCVFNAKTVYSCPNGGALSGAQCISSSSYAATPNYSCGAGTLTGTQCAVPQNYAATVNYSCPGGDPLSGSTCLKTTVYTATPSYSCPSGGSLNGTSCTVTSAYAATPNYSCTGADPLSGSTCTRTTTIAATPSYSCPNGAAPSNGQCTGTNSTSTAYIYLGGKQIAETAVGGATQYVHTDALGSPVAHTSQAGAETSRTKFELYGYTAGGTKPGPAMAGMPTTGSAIGFTGHVNDPETDLVYMQQRYYDPIAGRFLSIDPVVTDANSGLSFNRYSYVNNNPIRNIDPDGRAPSDLFTNDFVPPGIQFRQVVESIFGSAEPQPVRADTAMVSKTTITASYLEVSRTTKLGGDGSTFVGVRSSPGLAVQTSVEGQVKAGETSSGLTLKASASAGIGPLGATASAGATANLNGVSVQANAGAVGVANAKGIILGIRPPAAAVGVTIADKDVKDVTQ